MFLNPYINPQGKRFKIPNKVIRKILWEANPNCRFCGIETVLPIPNARTYYNPAMATIEHLYSKYNRRRNIGNNKYKITLACAKCNNERQLKESKELVGIDELRDRAKRRGENKNT